MIRVIVLSLSIVALAAPALADDLCQTATRALASAEEIRGLQKKVAVDCLVRDKSEIKAYVIEAVTTDTPPERIRGEGIAFKALGIIPRDFQYEDEVINLYTSQIGGYYDPKRDHFVMAAWIPASLQYPVAVHELVHALQDQYFDLSSFMDSKTMTSDELMARSALVEGDATAVMIDYSLRLSGAGKFANQMNTNMFLAQNIIGSQVLGAAENAPRALLTLMIFPYSSGLRFAHARLKSSGSYTALDETFKAPPRSTEEILHPEKYGSQKPDFERLSLPEDTRKPIHTDTLGEFFLATWLNSQGVEGTVAAAAAAGWGGDLLAIYEAESNFEILWQIRFDSAAEKKEFEAVLNSLTIIDSYSCDATVCQLRFHQQKAE